MEDFGTLEELGLKYNTDKAAEVTYGEKVYKGHDYLNRYEIFLYPLKEKEFTIVELGCFRGSSLKMWKEYFPYAQVVGVDLNENLKSLEEDRISFVCSDAVSEELPEKLEPYKGTISCIIDDCSHAWGDQRRSFEMLFPLLESGGYYIVEDLECGAAGAYPAYPPKVLDAQVFWDYAVDRMRILRVSENRNQTNFRPFFSQLPEHIQEIELSIDMAILVPGSIIFRKK